MHKKAKIHANELDKSSTCNDASHDILKSIQWTCAVVIVNNVHIAEHANNAFMNINR